MGKKSNNFLEQYKSQKWQKLRLKIFERDKWTCQKCFDKESQLQVHHRLYIYGNKVWEYNELDLVSLCNDCHESEKECMKEEMDFLVQILRRKLFAGDINNLVCSLGYTLAHGKHPPTFFIDALEWIIRCKLDENIIKPYKEHAKKRGIL